MTLVSFKPIGFVKSEFKSPDEIIFACEQGLDANNISRILVNEEFSKGLKGLEELSHLFVIYNLDRIHRTELITHPGPPSIEGLGKVGIFASRSQYRPNKIALRLVRLVKVEGNEIHVKGLDAINDSPVLDIKPYVSGFDRPSEFKDSPWYRWLL